MFHRHSPDRLDLLHPLRSTSKDIPSLKLTPSFAHVTALEGPRAISHDQSNISFTGRVIPMNMILGKIPRISKTHKMLSTISYDGNTIVLSSEVSLRDEALEERIMLERNL